MKPPESMTAILGTKRYTTAAHSVLLCGNDWWDGHNHERHGRQMFLYRAARAAPMPGIQGLLAGSAMSRAILLVLAILLAGCQSMADVHPGAGRTLTITGRDYEAIWQAAVKVAAKHFEIREQDSVRGTITGERTITAWGWGAWVGIYITPPTAGAGTYTVEVVNRKKLMTNLGEQGWEKKILRDLQNVLNGQPVR
jgi:hypothetical protein